MAWFEEPATPTQIQRLQQIIMARKQGIIPISLVLQRLNETEHDRFFYLSRTIDVQDATKGTAGELIGLVKKIFADLYELKIKSIEVE